MEEEGLGVFDQTTGMFGASRGTDLAPHHVCKEHETLNSPAVSEFRRLGEAFCPSGQHFCPLPPASNATGT